MESTTFAELPLGPKLQAAIEAAGYTTPTPIQAQAIPVAVTGRDVLGIAQTGTGKTASFVLPMIERLEAGRARARMPRSLILAPTRELAAQVAQSFEKYGINHKLNLALLIGGVSMDDQVKKLDRGVDVLIATPGRLLDHFSRGRVMLMGVEILVIDEADRMLDMGFIPDIEKICKLLPVRRQTLFFSATMPPEITRLVDQFLTNPLRIEVARPATTAKTITQRFRFCNSTEDWAKREVLRELIAAHPVKNAIIFCNRKKDVAILHKSLTKHGFNAGALHGDMDQKARMETLDRFRNGDIMLLAASDVAARGLDIPDVSHIFNFDIPWAGDDYVHRIGRTGRAGKEGVSLSIVSPEDLKLLKDIEKVTGETPTWIGEAPTDEDFAESGKRRRRSGGRGDDRRARAGGERRDERGGRERGRERGGERGRGRERHGEQPLHAGGQITEEGARVPRERQPRAPRRPAAVPAAIPGLGEQPSMLDAPRHRPEAEPAQAHGQHGPGQEPRRQAPRDQAPRGQTSRGQAPRDSSSRSPEPRAHAAQGDAPRSERPVREPRPVRSDAGGKGSGFADNLPAFLRRPVRPAKVASE